MLVDWLNKGYEGVLPIVPPDAEAIGIPSQRLGKVPGTPNGTGVWSGLEGWTSFKISPAEADLYDRHHASVGLLARRYPGIDVDVHDEALSNEIRDIALHILGEAPIRVGKAPKQLLMYATEDEITKKALKFKLDDDLMQVEILASGQQYVVEGIHPVTMQPYQIDQGIPDPMSLTVIDNEKIWRFLEAVVERLSLYGIKISESSSYSGDREGSPHELLIAKEPSLLSEALSFLPNNETTCFGWDEWIRIGAALHAATQEDLEYGRGLFHTFSAKAEHKTYNVVETDAVWNKYRPPYRVGADWFFRQAAQHGFNYALTIPHLLSSGPVAQISENPWALVSPSWITEEFKRFYFGRFKYIPEWKQFIWKKESGWVVDEKGVKTATLTKKYVKNNIIPRLPELGRDQEEGWITQKHNKLSDPDWLAKVNRDFRTAEGDLMVDAHTLDKDPNILNTSKGKYCLKTATLLEETEFDTTEICLKKTEVAPDFEMKTPVWDSFLTQITEGNPDVLTYLHRYAGYAATGHTIEQVFFLLHGKGGNGKSTFVNILLKVLGDYACTVPGDLFCETRKNTDNFLFKLHGTRLVVATEFGQRAVWDLGQLKKLTGGDVVNAKNLYKDPFEFIPTHTVLIASNSKPKIEYLDEAIKRRTRLIPFNLELQQDQKDPKLKDKLEAESPGILAWIIKGAAAWHQHGLPKIPSSVKIATDEYFGENDVVSLWIMDNCKLSPEVQIETSKLWASWKLYCTQVNEPIGTQGQFLDLLKKYGVVQSRPRNEEGIRRWTCKGITLLETEDDLESSNVLYGKFA